MLVDCFHHLYLIKFFRTSTEHWRALVEAYRNVYKVRRKLVAARIMQGQSTATSSETSATAGPSASEHRDDREGLREGPRQVLRSQSEEREVRGLWAKKSFSRVAIQGEFPICLQHCILF